MSSRFITVSLVLNIALLGLVAWMLSSLKQERAAANRPPPEPVLVTNTVKQIAVRTVGSSNFWAALAANQKPNWSVLESTNYVNYIENLRSIGCPEETIQDIIIADIAKTYSNKRAALRAQAPHPYWKSTGDWSKSPEGAALQQQLQALDAEEQALVKQLLGVDLHAELSKYTRENGLIMDNNYYYTYLPEEKRQKIEELDQKYAEIGKALTQEAKGVLLPQDRERYRRMKKQKEEELSKILSPEELEDYQVRNSATASDLRQRLGNFGINEEEFRKIFRVQKTFDDQFGEAFDVSDPKQLETQERAREQAQQALAEELKKELGDKRFTEYQRSQDDDYNTLTAITERFGGSREMAAKVYDMRQEAERQKRALETNPNLTPEQREAGLAALAKETQRAMAQSLGGNNSQLWKAYQQTGAQQWLENLRTSETPVPVETEPVEVMPAFPNLPPFPPFPPVPIVPTR